MRPCTSPGCQGRAASGRCEKCRSRQRKTWDRRRGRQYERYGPLWPIRRLNYLGENPWCLLCGKMATVPDHWPIDRKQLLAMGVPDPDADEYLRPLCAPCHNRQTAVHQPGGWNRDRR